MKAPNTYLVTVGWDSVEDDEDGIRASAGCERWRELPHPLDEPFLRIVSREEREKTRIKFLYN